MVEGLQWTPQQANTASSPPGPHLKLALGQQMHAALLAEGGGRRVQQRARRQLTAQPGGGALHRRGRRACVLTCCACCPLSSVNRTIPCLAAACSRARQWAVLGSADQPHPPSTPASQPAVGRRPAPLCAAPHPRAAPSLPPLAALPSPSASLPTGSLTAAVESFT